MYFETKDLSLKLYRIFSVLMCLMTICDVYGQTYATTKLAKGEGALALLRRFDLEKYSCNISEFYRINQLKTGDPLNLNKEYKLPIKIYKYDNRSIRTTIKIFDLVKAIEVENYNKWLMTSKIKVNYFLNDKLLWIPHHIYNCGNEKQNLPPQVLINKDDKPAAPVKPPISNKSEDEDVEPITTQGKFTSIPLFGSNYQNVEMFDERLKGKVFYIKSGHGGPDPGAMVKIDDNICCEDEYAYDVALRLGRKIIQHGGIVHFIVYDPNDGIRDDDFLLCDKDDLHAGKLPIPLNQIKRLRTRVEIINNLYYKYKVKGIKDQRFISIHVDSRSQGLELDAHFYYAEGSKKGLEMATNTQAVFEKKYEEQGNRKYTGTVKSRDLYVVKYSAPPALFVELGNIQNVNDQKRFLKSENRQSLADWLYEGFTK